jgi:hypothetical protein
MEVIIMSRVWVTKDWFIGLLYNSWLHFINHYHKQTSIHSHVFSSRCSVAACNGTRSPSSASPNCSRPQLPASNSDSSQRLKPSSSLTHSLTQNATTLHFTQLHSTELAPFHSTSYVVPARTSQKTELSYCCVSICCGSYLATTAIYSHHLALSHVSTWHRILLYCFCACIRIWGSHSSGYEKFYLLGY